jgi:aryl-alcohol dehydrogenase-like predicted oxidoreductase
MEMKRREFLKTSAIGVGAALLGAKHSAGTTLQSGFHDPFEMVLLGKTPLKVSRLGLGTGMRGSMRQSNHTRMGKEKLEALIRGAFDRGVRLFDLADLYGTHPFLTPALKGISRDKYQVVSKIWFGNGGIPEKERPDADVVVGRFLKEIQTDHLDLVLLHCVTTANWPEELRKQMDILARLKEKGIIRAHGVSCHSLAALEAAVGEPWVDSVHTRINPFGMSMDGAAESVAPVLQKLHQAGKGVIGMKIVGEGRLRDQPERRDESVRYVLGLGCVDVLNVGFETTAEIDDLAERVKKVPRKA